MGTWSVSTSGENYIMEYSNGFKRSIRKSQVTKTSQGAIVTYASSQSPNLTLAETIYSIQSYTAGTSTIDFTNNGGDDWDIGFKITPDTVQSTANIVGYQYYVQHFIAGVKNGLDAGFKTTDYTYNAVGNGAGVYFITQIYVFDDLSVFSINSLVKVDGIGTILYSIEYKGVTVNSVNGLAINATTNIVQTGIAYPIKYYSLDGFPPTNPPTLLGSGATFNTTIPIDSAGLSFMVDLGTEFTDDFPPPNMAASTLSLIIT